MNRQIRSSRKENQCNNSRLLFHKNKNAFLLVGMLSVRAAYSTLPAMSTPKGSIKERQEWLQHPSTAKERERTPLAPDPNRVVYMISPPDTDSRINEEIKDHYVMYYKNIIDNGKLLLFFPGTNGAPIGHQYILDVAARLGYRAIGLEYPNLDSVASMSNKSDDPDLSEKIRYSRFTGENAAPIMHMTPGNGIATRLLALLVYLGKHHPNEGWSRFYSGDSINWNLICVSGHSQGAGMAAYIAKLYLVYRAALISGPGDFIARTKSYPQWMTRPGKTPPERIYAMYAKDEARNDAVFRLRSYEALGLGQFGSFVDADSDNPPYHHTHIIRVTLPPRLKDEETLHGNSAHGSTATDNIVPLNKDGTPAYEPVWQYLFGGSPQ